MPEFLSLSTTYPTEKKKNSIINVFGIIYMYGKKSSFLEICNF